jgi:predicted RNase H-like nuclease (RuvC/YqgF family)
MENTIAMILTAIGGGIFSALIVVWGNRHVTASSAAENITKAANSLISPLEKEITKLVDRVQCQEETIKKLGLKIQQLDKINVRWECENRELRDRVKYLEDIISSNGLAHLLKQKAQK